MKKLIIFFSFSLIAASFGFATPPVANDDSVIVPEGGAVSTLDTGATSLLANDTDAENDTLTVNITPVSGPSHGALTLAADGTFSYTHDDSENLTDSFVYEISDSTATATATVNITVTAVNDPPVAVDDSIGNDEF